MLLKLLKTILTRINIMKSDSNTIQKASGNFNSSIIQVKGTYNAMTEQQMTDLCLRLIDEKLQPLREDARNTLRLLISEFSCELFERIGKLEGSMELLNSFAKPSVELALGESLMGYSQRPSDRHKRLLIETMIERLKVDDVSTKAILLDRIRLGIPQLTINQIDMIAIMVFTDLIVSCDTIEELKDYLRQLNPIVENASALTSVDFLYLQHTEFFHRISFAGRMDIIGDKLSRTYKTFFGIDGIEDLKNMLSEVNPLWQTLFNLIINNEMGSYSPTATGRYLGLIRLSEVLDEELSYEDFMANVIIKNHFNIL